MRPPETILWTPEGSFLSFQFTLQLASEPSPEPCRTHPHLLTASLQGGTCLMPLLLESPTAPGLMGEADIYLVMVHRTVWGNYFCL